MPRYHRRAEVVEAWHFDWVDDGGFPSVPEIPGVEVAYFTDRGSDDPPRRVSYLYGVPFDLDAPRWRVEARLRSLGGSRSVPLRRGDWIVDDGAGRRVLPAAEFERLYEPVVQGVFTRVVFPSFSGSVDDIRVEVRGLLPEELAHVPGRPCPGPVVAVGDLVYLDQWGERIAMVKEVREGPGDMVDVVELRGQVRRCCVPRWRPGAGGLCWRHFKEVGR